MQLCCSPPVAPLSALLRSLPSPAGEAHIDAQTAIPLYDAAHRLVVPGLAAACERYCTDALNPGTACTLLQRAEQFSMQEYAEQCLAVVHNRWVWGRGWRLLPCPWARWIMARLLCFPTPRALGCCLSS